VSLRIGYWNKAGDPRELASRCLVLQNRIASDFTLTVISRLQNFKISVGYPKNFEARGDKALYLLYQLCRGVTKWKTQVSLQKLLYP
jgi:hypothetical protein